jgi:hypothetical protein
MIYVFLKSITYNLDIFKILDILLFQFDGVTPKFSHIFLQSRTEYFGRSTTVRYSDDVITIILCFFKD